MRIHIGLTPNGARALSEQQALDDTPAATRAPCAAAERWRAVFAGAFARVAERIARDLREQSRQWQVLVGVAARSGGYGLYEPTAPSELLQPRDVMQSLKSP